MCADCMHAIPHLLKLSEVIWASTDAAHTTRFDLSVFLCVCPSVRKMLPLLLLSIYRWYRNKVVYIRGPLSLDFISVHTENNGTLDWDGESYTRCRFATYNNHKAVSCKTYEHFFQLWSQWNIFLPITCPPYPNHTSPLPFYL